MLKSASWTAILSIVLSLGVWLVAPAPLARACEGGTKEDGLLAYGGGGVTAKGSTSSCPSHGPSTSARSGNHNAKQSLTPEQKRRIRLAEWERCIAGLKIIHLGTRGHYLRIGKTCGLPPTPPGPTSPTGPSNRAIAYLAIAQFHFPTINIAMGPEPTANDWNIAVLGIPYWFWAHGTTTIPRTGQTVGPATAHLTAHLTQITLDLGDTTLTCPGTGTPRPPSTNLQTPSPTCGHTFTTKGKRTITATLTWTVHWEVNGDTGTITVHTATQRSVDVGELHTVIR